MAKRYRHLVFGVQPGRAPYRLRQARYMGMADDVSRFVQASDRPQVELLDVGVHSGVSRRYLEVRPDCERIAYHGVDIFPKGREFVYKHDEWNLHFANLEHGLPLASNRFDVVLCEQVLEHLYNAEYALEELSRVLRPGGLMIVGVPIFTPAMAWARKSLVPRLDRLTHRAPRGHVQAWSLATFRALVERATQLPVCDVRGFRFVSGGILRPLEHLRGWWQLNRALGARLPALCTEVQLVLTKPADTTSEPAATIPQRKRKAAPVAA